MRTRHFSELPKTYTVYPKVITGLIQHNLNKTSKSQTPTLPQVEYSVDRLSIDPNHLQKYNDICQFKSDGTVPAMYLAVLAQSLQMHMMTSEPFPFVLLGLVHIRNQITQHRIIKVDESIQLSCAFGELKPHDKGLQFDFIVTAKVNGETVFDGLTTYLSRQKTSTANSDKTKTETTKPDYQVQQTWKLAENTGRRYALISGDFNFIHIHALTAKAFGFNQAIAHGMWSKARALAAMQPLPATYQADVQFKLPMYLPSTVEFLTTPQEQTSDAQTEFMVRNQKNHKTHLVGTLTVQSTL